MKPEEHGIGLSFGIRASVLALLAVLGVGLSTVVAGSAGAVGQGSGAFVQWHVIFKTDKASLGSVAATSRHDIWAVGVTNTEASYAVHFNGAKWHRVALPDPGFSPFWVRASSAHDVWITGESDDFNGPSPIVQNVALIWDGKWREVAMPANTEDRAPVVLGRSDVWAAGASRRARHGWISVIWHWTGSSWTRYQLPVQARYGFVGGSSDRNLWAVGTTATGTKWNAAGQLATYRWASGGWHRARFPRTAIIGRPMVTVAHDGIVWVEAERYFNGQAVTILLRRRAGHWGHPMIFGGFAAAPQPPSPDGLTGVWFGALMYFSGRYWHGGGFPAVCRDGEGNGPFSMGSIPGTHHALVAGGCQDGRRTIPGVILISQPK